MDRPKTITEELAEMRAAGRRMAARHRAAVRMQLKPTQRVAHIMQTIFKAGDVPIVPRDGSPPLVARLQDVVRNYARRETNVLIQLIRQPRTALNEAIKDREMKPAPGGTIDKRVCDPRPTRTVWGSRQQVLCVPIADQEVVVENRSNVLAADIIRRRIAADVETVTGPHVWAGPPIYPYEFDRPPRY